MSLCNCDCCIEVKLVRDIAGYKSIRFQVDPTYQEQREVWMVNPQAIIDLPSNVLKFPLPPVQQWQDDKREGLRSFLSPELDGRHRVKHAYMPRLSAYRTRENRTPTLLEKFLGIRPRTVIEELVVFGNGRHRTAFSAYAGARMIPVQIKSESAANLRIILGENNIKPWIK